MEKLAFWLGLFSAVFTIIGFFLQYGGYMKKLRVIFENRKLIFVLLTICFLLSAVSIYLSVQHKTHNYRHPYIWTKKNLEIKEIKHHRFINQKVLLDGFEYNDCIFENVTFVYNGTSPIRLTYDKFYGNIQFATQSDIVAATCVFLKATGILSSKFAITYGPEHRELENVRSPNTLK